MMEEKGGGRMKGMKNERKMRKKEEKRESNVVECMGRNRRQKVKGGRRDRQEGKAGNKR